MTTTYALQLPTLEDYDLKLRRIPLASHANFALVERSSDQNGQTAIYTYSAGAAVDVVTVTAKRMYNAKTDMTNCSLRLSALVKRTVSETGEVTYEPIEAVIAWNHQGDKLDDSSFAVIMTSVAMSVVAQELTGANGTPTTKVVDKYDHAVLTNLFS